MIADSFIVPLILSLPAIGLIVGQFIFSRRMAAQNSTDLLNDFRPDWALAVETPPQRTLTGNSPLDLADQIIAEGERQILHLEEQLYLGTLVKPFQVTSSPLRDGIVETETRRAA